MRVPILLGKGYLGAFVSGGSLDMSEKTWERGCFCKSQWLPIPEIGGLSFSRDSCTDCPPKKYNRHLGIDCKRTLYGIRKNQTGLWHYDYSPTIQWRSYLIWPNNHKEIWIFVKQVTGPFFPSFVTWMYMNCMWLPQADCVHKRQALKHILFYLSNKGCSWQPKTLSDM